MDDPVTLTSAFLLGFFSTLHCIGMCGGIIGALSLSLPVTIRNSKPKLFSFVLAYNLGRIISYSAAGLIAGAVGTSVLQSAGFDQGHAVLRFIGISMMVAVGLYLTGWLPQLASVEKIGIPLWKSLEPIGQKTGSGRLITQSPGLWPDLGLAALRTGVFCPDLGIDCRRRHSRRTHHAGFWPGHFANIDYRRLYDFLDHPVCSLKPRTTGRWPVHYHYGDRQPVYTDGTPSPSSLKNLVSVQNPHV